MRWMEKKGERRRKKKEERRQKEETTHPQIAPKPMRPLFTTSSTVGMHRVLSGCPHYRATILRWVVFWMLLGCYTEKHPRAFPIYRLRWHCLERVYSTEKFHYGLGDSNTFKYAPSRIKFPTLMGSDTRRMLLGGGKAGVHITI